MRTLLIAGNWKMNPATRVGGRGAGRGGQGGRGPGDRRPRRRLPAGGLPRRRSTRSWRARRSAWAARTCTGSPAGPTPARSPARCCVDAGCTHVILGHSERRHGLGETDAQVNRKLHAALAARLIPIVCIGETKEERRANQTESVLLGPVDRLAGRALARADGRHGAGLRAGLGDRHRPDGDPGAGPGGPRVHPRLARRSSSARRPRPESLSSTEGASSRTTPRELLACPDIDGALVGGASLKASDFLAIFQAGQDVTPRKTA